VAEVAATGSLNDEEVRRLSAEVADLERQLADARRRHDGAGTTAGGGQ